MTSYRTKEEVEKSFEEEFTTVLATHQVGKNLLTDVRLVNPEVKAHIHSLRLSDLESIVDGIHERTRKGRYFINGESSKAGKYKNEGYHVAVKEITSYLKSLKQV